MRKLRRSRFPTPPSVPAQGAGWDVANVKMVESEKVGIQAKHSACHEGVSEAMGEPQSDRWFVTQND